MRRARPYLLALIGLAVAFGPPMVVAGPFVKHSEFVLNCAPEGFEMVLSGGDERGDLFGTYFGEGGMLHFVTRPLVRVGGRQICSCFESSYAALDAWTGIDELWDWASSPSTGRADLFEELIAPLRRQTEDVQRRFMVQVRQSSDAFSRCNKREVARLKRSGLTSMQLSVVIGAHLGLVR